MKLEKLRKVREQLDNEFTLEGISSAVYYYFGGKWNLLDSLSVVSDQDSICLDRAKADAVAYHATSSRSAWFACQGMNCSIRLDFTSSPRLTTRKQYQARLEQLLIRASNAFRVEHNQLTLLLAKDTFRTRLQIAMERLNPDPAQSPNVEGVESQRALAVFALDLDHFKQVNDSHGHLYGDQVLKTFGIRLEQACDEWLASREDISVVLGHPSGEEFLAFIAGTLTRQQLIEFGDFLRMKIGSKPLPSEDEWMKLQAMDNLTMLVPPPIQERRITTSIGMAQYVPSPSDESLKDRVSRLLDQADTALYRAKAGGRDQVIAFDDILDNCGRVLEQDVSTKIVAIDVGKNVGVTVGQEFRVFPPGFTGKRKFQISDGRSIRTIGTYPRFNLTRITVFDVQPELSFAFVADPSDAHLTIEAGSHLEAVALGSIGHLVPHASKYLSPNTEGVKIGDIVAARNYIEQNQATNPKPYALILRFGRSSSYLTRYGPVALNAALARLFRDATATFHVAEAINILDAASIVIVGRNQGYDEKRVETFVERLRTELPDLGLVGGVFCNADISTEKAPILKLDARHAVEFARFAASDHAPAAASNVTHFSYSTAYRILQALRDAQVLNQAQADFEKLGTLGLRSAKLSNLGGLIFAAQRKIDKAADLFEEAQSQDDNLVYKGNFMTVANSPGQIDRALRLFAQVRDSEIDQLLTSHPYAYFSYAKVLALAKSTGSSEFDQSRFLRVASRALTMEDFKHSVQAREQIARALATL
jgi:diguanylate cyclase (GGDEF)-like protein